MFAKLHKRMISYERYQIFNLYTYKYYKDKYAQQL